MDGSGMETGEGRSEEGAKEGRPIKMGAGMCIEKWGGFSGREGK